MAAPWPQDMPDFLLEGHAITETENVIREQMDVGPPKVRRRASAAPVREHAGLMLTVNQLQRFQAWYRGTTFYGTKPFVKRDAFGVPRNYFIVEPPTYTRRGFHYRVSLLLEYMP